MPFGLANEPATFQRFINDLLRDNLDKFCHAYIDDILIYSDCLESHRVHVSWVLEKLRDAGLQADLDKCEFHVSSTKYLGFIIGVNGISVDQNKIKTIKNWKSPTKLKELQSFLGFCNFYRDFVNGYSRIAKPLTILTRKNEPWRWDVEQEEAFESMKLSLSTAPVLKHFNHLLPTKLETDASNGVIAGVLSQQHENGNWHPTGFYSECLKGAELNYPIHDKELLAIIRSLELWRPELVGFQRSDPFIIITDHRPLEYFMTKRLLNQRQANWVTILSQYHCCFTYRPGSQNTVADSLSRKASEMQTLKERQANERTMSIFKSNVNDKYFSLSFDNNTSHSTNNLCVLDTEDDVQPLSGVAH